MGTNYYLHEKPPCRECGREYEPLHIGKSSGGWCFALHVIPGEIDDLPDWEARWTRGEIRNEYGDILTPEDMRAVILARAEITGVVDPPPFYRSWDEFHEKNSSEPGPAGLLRHRLNPAHCIRHGAGTYDCIIGEFS